MPRRRLAGAMLLAAAAVAGSVAYRRRAARHRERVDLYAGDGSMVSVADGAPEAAQLLALARELVHLAG
jgi:hypothetical protein